MNPFTNNSKHRIARSDREREGIERKRRALEQRCHERPLVREMTVDGSARHTARTRNIFQSDRRDAVLEKENLGAIE